MCQTESAIATNTRKLKVAQKERDFYQKALNLRLCSIYRNGKVNLVEVLFEVKSFDEFLNRLHLLKHIAQRDATLLIKMRKLNQEISDKLQVLSKQEKQRKSIVNTLYAEKKAIESKLARQKKLLSSVQGELSRLRRASLASRSYSGGSYYRVGNLVFPVAGPCSFVDSWHAPRRGHLHQGCDIMAAHGTPCVACVSGSVSTGYSGGGGKTIYLHGSDGHTYYYMHLSDFAVNGGSVSAGQVIGYVGSSGNASYSAPHLHFEIHPNGGGAVNPYPYLR